LDSLDKVRQALIELTRLTLLFGAQMYFNIELGTTATDAARVDAIIYKSLMTLASPTALIRLALQAAWILESLD
jgi:hypothetical protein